MLATRLKSVNVSPFLYGTVKTATNWASFQPYRETGRGVWGLKWQSVYSPGFERFFQSAHGVCTSKLRATFTCILTKPCLLEKVKKSLYGDKLFPRFNSWLIYIHRFVLKKCFVHKQHWKPQEVAGVDGGCTKHTNQSKPNGYSPLTLLIGS